MKTVKGEFFKEMLKIGFRLLETRFNTETNPTDPDLLITMINDKDGLDHELTIRERTKIINLSKKYNVSVSIAGKYWGMRENF